MNAQFIEQKIIRLAEELATLLEKLPDDAIIRGPGRARDRLEHVVARLAGLRGARR
jgi:hypothetical protein